MGCFMQFKITLSPQTPIDRFTIVIDIMTRTGKVISQVFCESEDLEIVDINSDLEIRASYNPIRFGEDEYMVSIGVFKYCNYASESENEAYCVVDRAVFFKIQQKEQIKKSMGAFAHPCIWSYRDKQRVFDAVKLK